jgi:hypothetical protein
MHRPGSNPESMTEQDFLCDFCGRCYAPERPMVEGHRGSLICGPCLALAYATLWNLGTGEAVEARIVCTLCLSHNGDPMWRSPVMDALVCKRCSKQSAVMLERDPESRWKRPR